MTRVKTVCSIDPVLIYEKIREFIVSIDNVQAHAEFTVPFDMAPGERPQEIFVRIEKRVTK